MNDIGVSFFLEKCVYHMECYKNITHSRNLERLVKRQRINPNTVEDLNELSKQLNDSDLPIHNEKPRSLRSKSQPYLKELCIICQQRVENFTR